VFTLSKKGKRNKMSNKNVATSDKKRIQKNRIMRYFIESVEKIIIDEGIDCITIRKVADLAGYNSATLYNYFDSLDHLIFMASMSHLEEYHLALPSYTKDCTNGLSLYMEVSRCFFKFSYADPEIYKRLFLQNIDDKYNEYSQQYYEIYPEKGLSSSEILGSVFRKRNLYERSMTMLNGCVTNGLLADGFITQENAEEYNNVALLIYFGMLTNVLRNVVDAETAIKQSMKYYRNVLLAYIKPKYIDMVKQLKI
jgi:AcrR family transcriptional regulator